MNVNPVSVLVDHTRGVARIFIRGCSEGEVVIICGKASLPSHRGWVWERNVPAPLLLKEEALAFLAKQLSFSKR